MQAPRLSRRLFLGLLTLCLLMSFGCAQRPRVRVMTWNIHHAEGTDKLLELSRIARVIRDARPDLVALQEVDRRSKRGNDVDQTAELARLTQMEGIFGKAMDYDGGEYGQAILTRFPIVADTVYRLPGSPGREPRIALSVRVRPDNIGEITFTGTHLDHQKVGERISQARRLDEFLANQPDPILVGDLNDTPGSDPILLLLKNWNDTTGDAALTFEAPNPDRKIDWVLLNRKSYWKVKSAAVLNEPEASDHRPVLVELEWTGKPQR